jgi:tetratricopeptide (TPR) repeat protein
MPAWFAVLLAPLAFVPAAPDCPTSVLALDARDQTLYRTVATRLDGEGLLATPLHTLERGGARWEQLRADPEGDNVSFVAADFAADLAYLRTAAPPGCAAVTTEAVAAPPPGSTLRVVREPSGFRPGVVGARVERHLELPDGRRCLLLHLLDGRGADPAIAFDDAGRFVGSVAPAPPGADPTFAVIVMAAPRKGPVAASSGGIMAGTGASPRAALSPHPAPSSQQTAPGLAGEAIVLGASGRADEALARLQEVIRLVGTSAPLLIERGVVQFGAGRLPAAVDDFTHAAEIDPTSHLARFNLGVALGMSGRYADAARALASARDLLPTHANTRFQLAMALKAADRTDAARQEWRELERLDPTLGRELQLVLGF